MNKYDLSDVTFLIPVSTDSQDRIRNLCIVISYLLNHFKAEVYIGERSPRPALGGVIADGMTHFHYLSGDPLFHKAKVLNDLAKEAHTNLICTFDSDLLLPAEQIAESVAMLRDREADVVIPYDGTVYNMREEHLPGLEEAAFNCENLDKLQTEGCRKRRTNSIGGCNIFYKKVYFEGGMSNEKFRSWGGEDDEIIHRFRKLEYDVKSVYGSMYHIPHARGVNSSMRNPNYKNNIRELETIGSMSIEDLKQEIKTWSWVPK